MKNLILIILFLIIPFQVFANGLVDSDWDGVPDKDEIEIYSTNINSADTDGDGYSDWLELISGFSPHNPKPIKLEDNDHDNDGLSDRMELNFHSSIIDPDTDKDGYKDGEEINSGYDPLIGNKVKLDKRIEVNIVAQELSYFLGGVRMGVFPVSSGKAGMYTPLGHYQVDGKNLKAWSKYGLWMPYWMSLQNGYFGIHELPEWPDGTKEGEDHLGKPVSHGCIRLGVGPAEFMYNWTEIGTGVFIY
ncbi:MAG: L,D-transpeptidase family protein [Patescibacteria group bacterium]|nr:L,D-transpeptidase family protein [Patescibacteria group bacterium]